ncbi:MAG: energy-coupling factor transporter transmembrane component T [Brachybacterium sp.]|uniref:energy-coupling factor transporter transmembrane component T n=1 Tax=Brachybacterium sp. AOP35-5H-19 TaxID=3457685 RepID=UPI003FEC8B10
MPLVLPGSGREASGLRLDPRTKLLVVLAVSWMILSGLGAGDGIGAGARWFLIALPALLFAASLLPVAAVQYVVLYGLMAAVPQLIWRFTHWDNIAIDTTLAWLGGMSLILPGLTCGWYALRTTTASEFIAAMQRLHCPDALTIPASVIFRFFPTVAEEYRDITTAMRMRGISGLRNPVAMLEYRFVPLLVSVVSIGNELSISAVTRGLGSGRKRTTICRIGFRAADALVISVLLVCALLLLGQVVSA